LPNDGHVKVRALRTAQHQQRARHCDFVTCQSTKGAMEHVSRQQFSCDWVGRIEKHHVERQESLGALRAKRAPVNIGRPAEGFGFDAERANVLTQNRGSTRIFFDEYNATGTAAQRFETNHAGAGEDVGNPCIAQFRLQAVEQRNFDSREDWTRVLTRRRQQLSMSEPSSNNLHDIAIHVELTACSRKRTGTVLFVPFSFEMPLDDVLGFFSERLESFLHWPGIAPHVGRTRDGRV